jgi:hypothetical protein
MFIALLSAWIVLNWAKKQCFRFSDPHYWAILILSIAGIYSIYHFIFHLVFLWTFLFLKSLGRKRDLYVVLSIPVLTGSAFLFWIPSLLKQMSVVCEGNYYFSGRSDPVLAIGQLLTLNFTSYLPFKIVPSVIILICLLILGIFGLRLVLSSKNGIVLTGALAVCFVTNIILDHILKTNTICVPKLAFFLSPISILFLVAGCSRIQERFQRKIFLYPLLLGLASVHSFFALPYDISIDGPYEKKILTELNRNISSASNNLTVFNQPRRRYALSFAKAMESSSDFVFGCDMLDSVENLDQYDSVIIVYFPPDNNPATLQQLAQTEDFIKSKGYQVQARYPCVMGRIIVLKQPPDNETARLKRAVDTGPGEPRCRNAAFSAL